MNCLQGIRVKKRIGRMMAVGLAAVVLLVHGLVVRAAGDTPLMEVSLEQDKIVTKQGETVKLTVNAALDSTGTGINAYIGKLEYDKGIFESISKESFKELNGWSNIEFNPSTGQFVAYGTERISVDTPLFEVKLKVKPSASGGDTTVKIKDFISAEGSDDFNYISLSEEAKRTEVDAKVTIPENPNNTNPENTNPNNSNNSNNTNQNSSSGNGGITATTTKKPKDSTGVIGHTPGSNVGNILSGLKNGEKSDEETTVASATVDTATDEEVVTGEGVIEDTEEGAESVKGVSIHKIIIPIIIILVILFIIFFLFKRRKKEKSTEKTLMNITIVFIATVMVFASTATSLAMAIKGEVNNDYKVNYDDVKLLQRHLIGLTPKITGDQNIRNADIDDDTYLTVNDLSMLIDKIKDSSSDTVTLSNVEASAWYPERGAAVRLTFEAEVEDNAVIREVVINGREYTANPGDTPGKYYVDIEAPSTPGVSEINFEYAGLDSDNIATINHKEKIVVKRNPPSISNYEVRTVVETNAVTISFELNDPENSFKDGTVYIRRKGNNSNVSTKALQVGANSITFTGAEGTTYDVLIRPNYYTVRDEDLQDGKTIEDNQRIMVKNLDQEAIYKAQYNLDITDLFAYTDRDMTNESKSTSFGKNDNIYIGFNSANEFDVNVRSLKINGRSYTVMKLDDGRYRTTLNGIFSKGENEVNISEVTLENGSVVPIDRTLALTILSARPEAPKPSLVEDESTLKVIADIVDKENTLISAEIIVTTSEGREILRRNMQKGVTFEETIDTGADILVPSYDVRIEGKCDVGAGEVTETFYEGTFPAIPKAVLRHVTVSKKSLTKDETYTVGYDLVHNGASIERVRVNGANVSGSINRDGEYVVSLRAPKDKVGNHTITLESVKLRNNNTEALIVDDGNLAVQTVEILKSVPKISDYSAADGDDKQSATFSFKVEDSDSAVTAGYIELFKPEQTEASIKEDFLVGADGAVDVSVSGVEKLIKYDVKITAEYKLGSTDESIDKVVVNKKYELVGNYDVSINDIKTYKIDGTEAEVFEKGEEIRVTFNSRNVTTDRDADVYYPEMVKIDGKWYELLDEGNNTYSTEITVENASGIYNKPIEAVRLNNTAEASVTSTTVNYEILKTAPRAKDVLYEPDENDNKKINISFDLVDSDGALVSDASFTVYDITDPNNEQNILTDTIGAGAYSNSFNGEVSHLYRVVVNGSYFLDDARTEAYKYENEDILDLEIDMGARMYEIKDVSEVQLYKKSGQNMELMNKVSVSELQGSKDNYVARVVPRQQPSFYANILEVNLENKSLKLKLDYDNVVNFEGNTKKRELIVNYGTVNDGVAESDTFESLIKRIAENPNGEFELNSNLDASNFKGSTRSMLESGVDFTGTLNGNGYTISNLSKPIFDKLGSGAQVKNLIIDNANINTGGARAPLANDTDGATVQYVFVTNPHITSRNDHVGGLIGTIKNSTVSNVAVTGLVINSGNVLRIGGIVGSTYNSSILDSYAVGSIVGTGGNNNHIGGIAGSIESNSKVDRVIANVQLDLKNGAGGNGGIVGYVFGGNSSIKNTLTLIEAANAQRINGGTAMAESYNNYALIISEAERGREKELKINEINDKFFKNTLGFSTDNWVIAGTSTSKLPMLTGGDPRSSAVAGSSTTDNVYIPDYEVVKNLGNYEKDKDILYSNLYKLMPFYESKDLLVDGAKISKNHTLNTRKIIGIIPYGEPKDGREVAIMGLSKADAGKIKYIKIIYDNDKYERYDVEYKSAGGNDETIACYTIPALKVEYNYDKYLVDTQDSLYQSILAKVKASDYRRDLDPLTWETETRNYVENYDRVLSKAEEFTLNLMANNPAYNVIHSTDGDSQKAIVKAALDNEQQLYKLLYTYNYFDRFYDIEIGGVNMRDVVFFDGRLFSDALNSINMTTLMIGKPITYGDKDTEKTNPLCERYTWNTAQYYNNTIKGYTGKELGDFLEYYMVNIVSDEEDAVNAADYTAKTGEPSDKANAWLHTNFHGYIYEAPAEDFKDFEAAKEGQARKFLEYRAWYHLKRMYSGNYILPFLTYDRDEEYNKDLYLVTYPTALMYGNMRLYWENWDSNPPDDAARKKKIRDFTDNAAKLYNTVGHIIDDRTFEVMNNKTDVNHDSTRNKAAEELRGITEEPVYKYINEVQNQWHRHGSAAAYANTVGGVFYCFYYTLNSYPIWTHENIHNQDGYMYLEGKGKRHSEPENFTDGILTQAADTYLTVPNFSVDYDWELNIGPNQTTQRIMKGTIDGREATGRERYAQWYKNAYEALRMLDYLEGKAFMELEPEEQSALAYQINYTNKDQNPTIMATSKSQITPEEFRRYDIQSFADLFDYRIVLERSRGGVISNSYWFIPTNDNNTITNESFKRNAHEMSAEGGYDGFVAWAGGAYRNDLDALRGITNKPNNTWRNHQISKYEAIGEKLKADNCNFNEDELIEWIKEGLKADAAKGDLSTGSQGVTNREIIYTHLKRITNDFESSIFDEISATQISSAQGLIDAIKANPLGVYELTDNLDFSSVSAGDTAYITNTFFGELEGNGYAIRGLNKPLFAKVMYATIKNVNIEGANITGGGTVISNGTTTRGALMNYGSFSTIKNIEASNITVSDAAGTEGGLIGWIERSYLEGFKVSGVNVTSTVTQTGGIVGYSGYTTIKDVHLNEHETIANTIDGKDRVGGAFGFINYASIMEECSAIADVTASGNADGALAGQIDNSKVINCYGLGTVKGNKHAGGLTGWAENTYLYNSYAKADISVTSGASGGFIGRLQNGKELKNSVSYGNAISNNTYKFDGETQSNVAGENYANNFEYELSRGASTLKRTGIDWTDKVSVLDEQTANTVEFYTNRLSWGDEAWDYSLVEAGGLPFLKSERDTKRVRSIINRYEIATPADFAKINDDPYGYYTITENIDLSSLNGTDTESIITADFGGILEGDGHTVYNNTKPIFKTISEGKINNLKVEGMNVSGKNYGFAKTINNSRITKLYISNSSITTQGINGDDGAYIGMVASTSTSSVFKEIAVVAADIKAWHTAGGVIAQANSGVSLEDIYVSGSLTALEGRGNSRMGGVIGWNSGGASMNRVITNVELKTYGTNNGGIVGGPASTAMAITNALSYGTFNTSISGYTVTGGNNTGQFKKVYEYQTEDSTLKSQKDTPNIYVAGDNDIESRDFFIGLSFDPEIWDLDNLGIGGPGLKGAAPDIMTLSLDEDDDTDADDRINNGTTEINDAKELIDEVENNPQGEFELKDDLDFEDIETEDESYIEEFSGKLVGNGFVISGLKKPLINSAKDSSIENIRFVDVEIESESEVVGSLINTGENVSLSDIVETRVHVTGSGMLGGLVGSLTNSKVESISVNEVEVVSLGVKPVGGLAGEIGPDTSIDNLYISGRIVLKNMGEDTGDSVVGAVAGIDNGAKIAHSIVNVNIISNTSFLEEEILEGTLTGPSEGDDDLDETLNPDGSDSQDGEDSIEDEDGSNTGGDDINKPEEDGEVDSDISKETIEELISDPKETPEEDEEEEADDSQEEHTNRIFKTRWKVGTLIGQAIGETSISNTVTYGVGSGNTIVGIGEVTELTNVHQYREDLTCEDIQSRGFFEDMGFDEEAWNLEKLGIGGPGLKIAEDNVKIIPIDSLEDRNPLMESLVEFACQFVGNPYVYGGESLTNGADCSGFVKAVFGYFGKADLPHSSAAIRNRGTAVDRDEIMPGDIICYDGHVAIYIGNGQIVHAANEEKGIIISDMDYMEVVAIRRLM